MGTARAYIKCHISPKLWWRRCWAQPALLCGGAGTDMTFCMCLPLTETPKLPGCSFLDSLGWECENYQFPGSLQKCCLLRARGEPRNLLKAADTSWSKTPNMCQNLTLRKAWLPPPSYSETLPRGSVGLPGWAAAPLGSHQLDVYGSWDFLSCQCPLISNERMCV